MDEEISLEKFLEDNDIGISEFIESMDHTQVRYKNTDEYMQKYNAINWIIYAFDWWKHKENNWSMLNKKWVNKIMDIEYGIRFFKTKKSYKKIKITFE